MRQNPPLPRKSPKGEEERQRRARRQVMIAAFIAAALVLVAGATGWFVYQAQSPDEPRVFPPSADEKGIRIGTGRVIVDVYLDAICPACKRFEQQAGKTLDELVHDNKITIVYHPLGYLDGLSTTGYSSRAAEASVCASEVDRFVEYLGVLFDNQPKEGGPGLTDDRLVELAGAAGIDTTPFRQCLDSDKYVPWVAAATQAAEQRGIEGTPTVLVDNGEVTPSPSAIRKAVDSAAKTDPSAT